MATGADLVKWAQSQIGVTEYPPNSNIVKYWDWYKQHTGVNLQGSPWCVGLVTCGMGTIGAWNVVRDEPYYRYCPSVVAWAKANGLWLGREAIPEPGDFILFANEGLACHIGIVERRLNATDVQTIEGNTSVTSNDNGGAVMRRTRTYGKVGSDWYILGFVRPKWKEEDVMATKEEVAKAVWEYGIQNWNKGIVQAQTMLSAVDAELQRTDDPSGRNVKLKNHDHLKWMAAKQSKMEEDLVEIKSMLADLISRS